MERIAKDNLNMKIGVSKDKLVITVDLKDFLNKAELSESGKSYIIASSKGNKPLTAKGYEDIKFGANVFVSKARFEELKQIAELEARGGKVVSGLPSQDRDKELEEKDKVIAEQGSALVAMQEQMAQLMAMMQAQQGTAPVASTKSTKKK